MKPRWYQQKLIDGVRQSWLNGHRNVVCVSPPRSGKTPTAYWIAEPFIKRGCCIVFNAHREELVKQLSMTFAEFGTPHRLMAPVDVVKNIVHKQYEKFGKSFVNNNANVLIGSVQTINARSDKLASFFSRVSLWMTDEAHHCLPGNQWGKVISQMPNAYGVGFTATPGRTDRKSLASSQGGIFDDMVKGVTARQLINEGFICDYKIIAPPSSIDRESIKVGQKGEFTQKGLSEAKRDSTITGDCVKSYLDYSKDKQAVVFAVDINHAVELTQAYVAAGVSAEVVSSKTNKMARKLIMDKFQRGVFKVLVNVDLFGEGLNVEGIETVIMARPTKSFILFVQQFFRALTKPEGSDKFGTIIDHAGNVGYFGKFYGLPDSYNAWTLVNEERSKSRKTVKADVVPITVCTACFNPYEAVKPQCPFCGHKPAITDRSAPEHVEGDLVELSAEILAEMRGEIERIDAPARIPARLSNTPAELSIKKKHVARQEAQKTLRDNITFWAGYWRDGGVSDSEIYRRFFAQFDVDIMTCQTYGKNKADELSDRVEKSLYRLLNKKDD